MTVSRGCLGFQKENGCIKEQSGGIDCYCNTNKCNGATGKWISTFLMNLLFVPMRM